MTTEKQNNNKHIRILLEVIGMVAVCVALFVVVKQQTKENAKDIVTNCASIEKNGAAVKELIKIQTVHREDVLEMKGTIGKIDVKQQAIKEGIARIEKKL